jgi:hypothetical protein
LLLRRVRIGVEVLLIATACAALLSCAGISSASQKNNPPPPADSAPPPPASGIRQPTGGLIVHRLKSYPLQFPYGQFRGWDSGGGEWPNIETCLAASGNPSDPCFDWTRFDTQMARLNQAGVNDVLYTLSRTPLWAVDLAGDQTAQNGTECDYYAAGTADLPEAAGQCLTPDRSEWRWKPIKSDVEELGDGSSIVPPHWSTMSASSRTKEPMRRWFA